MRLVVRLSNMYRRVLAVALGCIGPGAAYGATGFLARLLYRLLEPVRTRAESQCRAALGKRMDDSDIAVLAEHAFVHRVWNLTDLMLADRFLHPGTFHRYGGQIPEPFRGVLLDAQHRRHPVILVTAYYGPFDLLPLFLGYNGVRAAVAYRPHRNPGFDAYRLRIRARSGCELVPVERAAGRFAQVLAEGGTVALVADHHAERRGLPVTFLGLPTTAMRSVALLAQHYSASVGVAGIRRVGNAFRFEIVVSGILHQHEWASAADPAARITDFYLRALEQIILADPVQYLWTHARWGEEAAQQLADSDGAPSRHATPR